MWQEVGGGVLDAAATMRAEHAVVVAVQVAMTGLVVVGHRQMIGGPSAKKQSKRNSCQRPSDYAAIYRAGPRAPCPPRRFGGAYSQQGDPRSDRKEAGLPTGPSTAGCPTATPPSAHSFFRAEGAGGGIRAPKRRRATPISEREQFCASCGQYPALAVGSDCRAPPGVD